MQTLLGEQKYKTWPPQKKKKTVLLPIHNMNWKNCVCKEKETMSSFLNFGVVKFGNYMVSARFVLAWALASCSLGCRECALHRTPSHGTLHKKAFDLLPHVRIICCIVKLPTMCLCVCVSTPPFPMSFFYFLAGFPSCNISKIIRPEGPIFWRCPTKLRKVWKGMDARTCTCSARLRFFL